MMRYKLTIAYDGTGFHGFQSQPGMQTIAGVMQESIKRVFGISIILIGVSRTDAGVHAQGQVATCLAEFPASSSSILHAWNNQLPLSIRIHSLEVVAPSYSIFAHIAYKTYHYRLFFTRPSPFEARYGWYVPRKIDVGLLQEALQVFVGTHDFRSFSTGYERGEDTIRRIDTIVMNHIDNGVLIRITGEKFLHHMIRRIVGAACDIASRPDFSIDCLSRILQEKNPRQCLTNAPAHGLTLESITYKTTELQ